MIPDGDHGNLSWQTPVSVPGAPAGGGGGRGGTGTGTASAAAGGTAGAAPNAPGGGPGSSAGSGGGAGAVARDAGSPDTRPSDAIASAPAPNAAASDAISSAGTAPSDELYDPKNLPRFDLEIPPESIAGLNKDGRAYARATLKYGAETVADIGVHLKGEASFRPLAKKAAFKLKFDEFVPDRTFRGLERMTWNNMMEDPSFIAERLSYLVFRTAGLPAPRANSALVYVNGAYYGVYTNLETEDKTFLRAYASTTVRTFNNLMGPPRWPTGPGYGCAGYRQSSRQVAPITTAVASAGID